MVSFSKLIDGQRGTQLLLDSDGFLYSRRADRDTSTTSYWRCQKYRTKKCTTAVTLNKEDLALSSNQKPHSHQPGSLVAEKAEFRQTLKRRAADQHLSATQNLLSEALSGCSSNLNVQLPKLESLARFVQRSRASGNVVGVLTATCSLPALVLRITPQLLSIFSSLPSTSATP